MPGIAGVADQGHRHQSQYCSTQKSLDLLTLLVVSGVDHVTVNAGDIEGDPSMLSHPQHLWVIYIVTYLVSLLHSVSIIIFGKHAFESGYGHMSYQCLI